MEIERFITDEILLEEMTETKLDPDESLLSSGILDSMTLIRLVAFLEDQFGLTVGDEELIPANFETLSRIKAFLEHKQHTCE